MIKHFLIVLRNAQINQRYQSKKSTVAVTFIRISQKKCKRLRVRLARADLTARNMKSCFQHEKTHLFTLPKNKTCTKRSC